MKDRIALVTGSSRGIGREIALKLAQSAAGVAVHYHRDQRAADAVVQTIRRAGKDSAAFPGDLVSAGQARSLIEDVEGRFGRIDILINNVGPFIAKPWQKLEAEDWTQALNTNLMSAFHCLHAALPGMRCRRWGRIVNIGYSRVEQLTNFPTILPYAAAKVGLLLLTRTAAAAEASHAITVNMVSPGLIEGGTMPKDPKIPCGRPGRPDDVAHAVQFLVSEESGYITGENLVVAGGWKL